ncbi:MAG: tetratricopeptide repeat protein, partial [Planctomycetes bacterium]|nr:tetratricopeptide repeat protein [Planctomycetota bacterium]
MKSVLLVKKCAITAVILFLVFPAGQNLLAGGGAENVVVVVNEDSWASMTVANEFIHLRKIPPVNVIYLSPKGRWSFKSVSINTFREYILKPILAEIKTRGLEDQIDYIVYSADFPYRIHFAKDLAGKKVPKPLTANGSITALTYLYRWVLAKQPLRTSTERAGYLHLHNNWYFRPILRRRREPARFTPAQREIISRARLLMRQKKWQQAEKLLRDVLKDKPEHAADLYYNLACCLARQNRPDEAIKALRQAIKAGWSNRLHTEYDEDLKPLRKRADFKKLLERIKPPEINVLPPVRFSSKSCWTPRGGVSRLDNEPCQRYLLSVVLAVTSGRGMSVSEATDYLRRSVAADGTEPTGTIYYMVNGDIRTRVRRWAFAAAVKKLKSLGVKAEIVKGILPRNKNDVMGLSAGSAKFSWSKSGSKILPGAICEHLTSHGGNLEPYSSQTPCTEFLRAGAAGTCGTVSEPYAVQAKFPNAFIHYFYASGCSLAEAFYQSVSGPYQLLIIGDPLCQPWAKRPTVVVRGISSGQEIKGKITISPSIVQKDMKIRRYELFIDGVRKHINPPDKPFEIDTTELADGWHELRIVAIKADLIETQGRWIGGIIVNNHGLKVAISRKFPKKAVFGKEIILSVDSNGAKRIGLFHNHRELASIEAARGTIRVDSRRIGLGNVHFQAVGLFERNGRIVRVQSSPIEITIIPPAGLKGKRIPANRQVKKGIKLIAPDGKVHIVEDMQGGKALIKAGVKKGESFQLDGFFDVPKDDVYQFQINFDGKLTIMVDSHHLDIPANRG